MLRTPTSETFKLMVLTGFHIALQPLGPQSHNARKPPHSTNTKAWMASGLRYRSPPIPMPLAPAPKPPGITTVAPFP